ncbi:MAG TPA: TonB-dependent receptor [Bryobacteraceae bacterium]|nr:TonB-dependent receptor [Bryobacteraceae bacterium]
MRILIAACAASVLVYAQSRDTIVVTGTYEPVPLNEVDRSLDVLTLNQKTVLLYNSVSDLFQLDSSLDLQQRAPDGVQGDLSIRGSTFGQTLILLNGMRLNDAQSGHHNLDIPIPLEMISRVEVLLGSGSTQYGTDASGGVVNVVTVRPETWEARVRAALGSFGTNQEGVILGGTLGNYSEVLAVSRDFSTGFRDDRDYRNLMMASSTMLRDRLGAASVMLALADRPFGADQFYGDFNSWERTKTWFVAGHQNIGDNTEADFAFHRHSDLFVLFRNDPEYFTNRHVDETWEGALRRTDALPVGSLHYGAEFDADSIDSNNLGVHSRAREGVYLAYDVRAIKRFSLNVGLRDDIYDGFRNQLSPNISGAAWITSSLKARAGASRAFRLPSYTDLYYHDPGNVGSPNLKPEVAWNYEGGLDWRKNSWGASLTVFQRRDESVIDFVQYNPNDIFRATNFQNLTFTGVEASVKVEPWRRQRFEVEYSGLRGNEQLQLAAISRYVFNYPVHSGVMAWEGELPYGFIGRTRIGVAQRTGRDAYAVWDASFARATGHFRPFLQLTNIGDSIYQVLPGIAEPGRAVLGGVELAFR